MSCGVIRLPAHLSLNKTKTPIYLAIPTSAFGLFCPHFPNNELIQLKSVGRFSDFNDLSTASSRACLSKILNLLTALVVISSMTC